MIGYAREPSAERRFRGIVRINTPEDLDEHVLINLLGILDAWYQSRHLSEHELTIAVEHRLLGLWVLFDQPFDEVYVA
jgi:hypothetical protein